MTGDPSPSTMATRAVEITVLGICMVSSAYECRKGPANVGTRFLAKFSGFRGRNRAGVASR